MKKCKNKFNEKSVRGLKRARSPFTYYSIIRNANKKINYLPFVLLAVKGESNLFVCFCFILG